MATVSVRYIVDDVEAAIAFYCDQLEFHQVMHPAPTFAMLDRGELRLVLSAPGSQGGGGQAMPDGTKPEPGGWNRFAFGGRDETPGDHRRPQHAWDQTTPWFPSEISRRGSRARHTVP
jgi:catechol 2,3-dioxygenase-like lactoylglutathione lyase family enzyme